MLAPQATFTAGRNKLYLDYWVKGESGFVSAASAAKLDLVPAFAQIKATIAAITADAGKNEDAKATAISSYVSAIDGTFNIGLAHGALQNWGKALTAKYLVNSAPTSAASTLAAAQGAGLILHGLKDAVADVGNTKILSAVASGVSTALESKSATSTTDPRTVGGVRWLALGVTPATAVTDNGHVADASFLTGKTAAPATTGITTNITDTTAFVDKTPVETIGLWLGATCRTALNADAVP
jgi:hypothetical protein